MGKGSYLGGGTVIKVGLRKRIKSTMLLKLDAIAEQFSAHLTDNQRKESAAKIAKFAAIKTAQSHTRRRRQKGKI
jgi:hypothetical protein